MHSRVEVPIALTTFEERSTLKQDFRYQDGVSEINEVMFDVDTNQDNLPSDLSNKKSEKFPDATWQPHEMGRASEASSEGTVKDAQQQAVLRDKTNPPGRKSMRRSATLSKIDSDLMKRPPARTRLVRSRSTQIRRSGMKPPR